MLFCLLLIEKQCSSKYDSTFRETAKHLTNSCKKKHPLKDKDIFLVLDKIYG